VVESMVDQRVARTIGAGRDMRWLSEGSLAGARDEEGVEVKPRGCSLEHG
jgi:hypothetical protein